MGVSEPILITGSGTVTTDKVGILKPTEDCRKLVIDTFYELE
jgi:hypothetical protein